MFIGKEYAIQQSQTVKDAGFFFLKIEKVQIHIKKTSKVYSLLFHWG